MVAAPSSFLVTAVLAVHVKVGVILLPLLLALILRDSMPVSRPVLLARAVRVLVLLLVFTRTAAEQPDDEIRPSSCLLAHCEEMVDDDDGAAWELRRRSEEKFILVCRPAISNYDGNIWCG